MNTSARVLSASVFVSFFLTFQAVVGGLAVWRIRKVVSALRVTDSIQSICDTISLELSTRFPLKCFCIDLNGAYCRLSGRRLCNERMRYTNGMLGYTFDTPCDDMPTLVPDRIREEAAWCKTNGIPFLWALAPCKIDWNGDCFPSGWMTWNPNRLASGIASQLAAEGVETLDLIPTFAGTPELVTRNFFETDHHWRYEAALRATGMLVDRLADLIPDASLKGQSNLQTENWKWTDTGCTFLGSHGRRVGRYFGGISQFRYCTPRFKGLITRRNVSKGKVYKGGFSKSEMVSQVLREDNLYRCNKYSLYTGSDVGLQQHENLLAPNHRRIMIIKDSFGDPVSAFLTTVFTEVIQVDPRRIAADQSVLGLLESYHPDAVVECCGAMTLFAQKAGGK